MIKNEVPSSLDYTNAITNSHNEEAKALNVIAVNSLVPVRFGKVEIEYILSGNGAGEVGRADYYSNGVYQETRIVCRGDALGSAHKTTISFINRTPASLAGKSFVLYDSTGAVNVWFNVDFANSAPVNPSTYRDIQINLLTGQDHETVAKKVALALSMDTQFLAVYSMYYVIISSSSTGVKENSHDVNTGLFIKNTAGVEPQTLNNKYFYINSATNANEYYVWYNVNGAGVDPLVPSKTGLMVAISTGSSSEAVAQATKIVLDATGKFITNISSDTLVITNELIGVTDLAKENNTGFLVFVQKAGEDRELLATLIMTYNSGNCIIAVERL
jgi:hypothetical protein